jgi:hypothetical protein
VALLDVCDEVRLIVLGPDPDPDMRVDTSCAEPLLVEARTLYVFDTDQRLRSIETGPTQEEAFVVLAAYVHALTDEEPRHERQREVTIALSDMRDRWVTRLLDAEASEVWGQLTDVRAEYDYIRTLGVRGIAVRVQGTRVRG